MTDAVEFFLDDITCLHCNSATKGIVFERTGQILCTECDEAIFDAADVDGGTVVILQLDDEVMH